MIIHMREDGYIKANLIYKAGNKLFGHYKENKQARHYLPAFYSINLIIRIPIIKLIE